MRRESFNDRGVAVVGIRRGDVEVADQSQRQVGRCREGGCGVLAQRLEPVELVDVVGVLEGTTIGDVEAPDAHAVDGRTDRAGFLRSIRALVPLREAGHPGEGGLDLGRTRAAGDRDTVPLREAMGFDVEPCLLELFERELLDLALDLLHCQHVDVFTHREVDDPVDPGADGVHVPGGKAHGLSLESPADVARFLTRAPGRGVANS